jgi:hypothetical protein
LPLAEAGAGGQFEYVEWTLEGHPSRSRFMGLGEDKKAKDVRRESDQGDE